MVSIPIWFDLKNKISIYNYGSKIVSIPIWFDLKLNRIGIDRTRLTRFNSNMVRFKVLAMVKETGQEVEFQFQYGSI